MSEALVKELLQTIWSTSETIRLIIEDPNTIEEVRSSFSRDLASLEEIRVMISDVEQNLSDEGCISNPEAVFALIKDAYEKINPRILKLKENSVAINERVNSIIERMNNMTSRLDRMDQILRRLE